MMGNVRFHNVVSTRELAAGAAALVLLWLLSLRNYLLFHSLSEFFSIAVACGIFLVAYNTRSFTQNGYLLFLGAAYAFVGALDLLHLLSYKGMGVFPARTPNLATQLWIAARGMEAASLLAATWFTTRPFPPKGVAAAYLAATAILLWSVFAGVFPDCYTAGGLTRFKQGAEYVVMAVLAGALFRLYRRREYFGENVFVLMAAAIVLTMFAEFSFTLYVSVYGLSNMAGHLLKIASFYLVYKALVRTSLTDPYRILFRRLSDSREELARANDRLEERVKERTKELLEAQQALSAERLRLFSVLESLPAFVYLRGRDCTIRFANRFFRERFGEGQGLCHQVLYRRESPCADCPGKEVFFDGKPREWEFSAPDGRIYRVFDYPFTDTDGATLALQLGLDITERRKAREALVLYAKKLAEQKEEIQDLAHAAAHDLQEPLRKVYTFSDRLKTGLAEKLSDKDRYTLDRLMHTVASMRAMASALVEYHKAASGSGTMAPVDLAEICRESAARLKSDAAAAGCEIRVGNLPEITADPGQMSLLFDKLLSNAIMHRGDQPAKITVDSRPLQAAPHAPGTPGPWHEIRVADMGPSFDPKYAERIFRPFERLVSREAEKRPGMGLAIARRIVERHGGSISVTSRQSDGTAFFVVLPESRLEPEAARPWETTAHQFS
ncbi:MAG: hypothetical protein JRI97_02835 [Deltaproteobacteria bacterium]|nr:hypothetical protein [Deltaproteobacteria bacterium]